MKKTSILVVGGGNAGLSVIAQLLLKDKNLSISLVEPSEKHYYQPAWTLVGADTFDAEKTVRKEKDFVPKNVDWIKAKCSEILPDSNQIRLDNGERIEYEYLVMCPGIQLDWHKIEGLEGNLGKNGLTSNYLFEYAPYTYKCFEEYKGGNAIFTNPGTPIKCGGAPQKIMHLFGDYLRKNNKKGNTYFYSAGKSIFGIPKYAETLEKVMKRNGAEGRYQHNLVGVRAAEKIAIFETAEGNRVEEKYDFMHITPPQSAPDFVKNSPLAEKNNPLGWIEVDKYSLQHTRYPNVFACGDASNTPNAKTGAAVRKQVPVLVDNLYSLMKTGKLGTKKYNGYGSCPLVTGYGKLVLAEFDYDNNPTETFPFNQAKERWSMWFLKKYILPWLYWNKILKGKA